MEKAMKTPFDTPVVCPVLIGREADLAALLSLTDRAKNGEGQVALLSGEAGVGKSRLVSEIKVYAAAQGFLPLQGNCFPTDLSYPYAPLLDLLRTLFAHRAPAEIADELGPYGRELFPLLPDIIHLPPEPAFLPSSDPEQEKRRLSAVLAQFFINQAAKQPLLLIVEDLHWCDDTSLEFLHYLVRRCVAQPILILLTYRNDEVRPSLRHALAQLDRERIVQEFPITHLTRSDVAAMLRAIFDLRRSSFDERHLAQGKLLDPIYTLTEGNPFFIEEILKALLTAGKIFYAGGAWDRSPLNELHIPRSIQDAVQQRSDHLSESAREILLLAAVAGRRFDFALLQKLTQHDERQLLLLMKELIAAQFVVEESEEQFAFRHALTRQAIYTELLVRERKVLHRIIAETMEQLYNVTLDAHLADIAYHFYEAGTWERALEYAQRAGEKALELYAPYAAIEHFTRALRATRHLGRAVPSRLYQARGRAYEALGEFEQARSDFEQVLDTAHRADDGVVEWQSVIDLGFLWSGRDYEQARTFFLRAVELAKLLADPKMHAHSLNRMGNWHLNVEQPLEALRYHREALAIFQELQDQHGIAETLDLLGMVSYLGGDLVQGTAYYQQAIELFRQLDDRQGLTSGLATLTLRSPTYQTDSMVAATSSLAEVIPDAELALKIASEIGQRSAEVYALFQLALCLGSQGDYARALASAQESLEIAEEIEHRQWITASRCVLGALYCDVLALPTAQEHFEQALALARETGSLVWIRIATGYLASTYILLNDLTRAETVLNAALDPHMPAQTMAQRLMWCASVELAVAQGNPNSALEITDQLIASAANISTGRNMLRVSKLRGEVLTALNRVEEAKAALEAAQEVATAQGARPKTWRIAVDLGKLFQGQARHDEAERAFSAARILIEELAVNIPGELLRDNFLRQATAMLPRTRPLSQGHGMKQAFGGLTEREREVAALIAQGKSNQAIADGLVVTKRTVETHISNILFKLGCASRTQIAVWAVETGLLEKSE
jgi:DNA-binding CsgD family transcriptional regulator